jgi:hypothetical protein
MVSFFFFSAIRLTGPFVTMVYSMIVGDMLTFGIIYSIVLFGFSQSFYFLYKGFPGVKTSLYHSYSSTWMALFQITLGDYNVSMCLLIMKVDMMINVSCYLSYIKKKSIHYLSGDDICGDNPTPLHCHKSTSTVKRCPFFNSPWHGYCSCCSFSCQYV